MSFTDEAVVVIREAIRTYGRTNTDELWRQREAEFIVARLADREMLAPGTEEDGSRRQRG